MIDFSQFLKNVRFDDAASRQAFELQLAKVLMVAQDVRNAAGKLPADLARCPEMVGCLIEYDETFKEAGLS